MYKKLQRNAQKSTLHSIAVWDLGLQGYHLIDEGALISCYTCVYQLALNTLFSKYEWSSKHKRYV